MMTTVAPRFLFFVSTCFFLSAPAAEFQFGVHQFTVPEGFVLERVAGPPLVDRPIMADFDEQGRLYVADSSGSNDKVEKQLEEKPHRIVRLEDTDGDGFFDKSVVFADRMMFPEGILWHDGAVYCGAPPTIWKLEDLDGDGVADRRTAWHEGKTLTGCANDLHGPYLGPDGWIYWCKGAFAKQTYERPGRPAISDSAAHIFRCRPDGSEFDSLMSGGMDNPVEIAFSPEGEAFFTTTFYSHPQAGQRDALVHAIYGGVYPKTHGVLDGLIRTGDLMPAMTHLGPAVPSGLARYESRVFGEDYQGNLFSTQFNLRRIQRHVLERDGATFRTRDFDFMVSDHHDFHPTDVLEDADGSLLVVDTGGWYKLCCPTSQIAKPEVLGAIYRIKRVGAPRIDDPRGQRLAWRELEPSKLIQFLDDKRPAVRKRALETLAQRGESAVPDLAGVLANSSSWPEAAPRDRARAFPVEIRRNAVWALTRLDDAAARAAARLALMDSDPSVRQAAIHSAGMHRDSLALPQLLTLLKSEDLHLKRNAATALGRIGDASAVASLLAETAKPAERVLEHSLIYALIEIGDARQTRQGLLSESPLTRRAALIALDQMKQGGLEASEIIPDLDSGTPVLRETAAWLVGLHSDWGGALTEHFRRVLRKPALAEKEQDELRSQLAQFSRDVSVQRLLTEVLREPDYPLASRQMALEAMAKAPLKELPEAWGMELRRCFEQAEAPLLGRALAVFRSLPTGKEQAPHYTPSLLKLGGDPALTDAVRLAALGALPPGLHEPAPEVFEFLTDQLKASQPAGLRSSAAEVLGRASLSESQLELLLRSLEAAGPMEFSKLLGAFEKSTNEALGLKLAATLKRSRSFRSVRPDQLKALLEKYPQPVQETGRELFDILHIDLAKQKEMLDRLHAGVHGGDRDRGRRLFESSKTACATCHRVGYLGGRIGPDLTRIGSVRTERDLLESIVFPSASFVRSYEPVRVATTDGEEYSGLLQQESSDTIVLVNSAGAEQRVALARVAEIQPGTVSIMPGGLDEQLSQQEMADLIAFLKSLK